MGNNFTRKIRRKGIAKKKRNARKDLNEKMGLFLHLPTECDACTLSFDKQNKRMLQEWNVVVRKEKKVVRLYCPECWNKARKMIEEEVKNMGGVVED